MTQLLLDPDAARVCNLLIPTLTGVDGRVIQQETGENLAIVTDAFTAVWSCSVTLSDHRPSSGPGGSGPAGSGPAGSGPGTGPISVSGGSFRSDLDLNSHLRVCVTDRTGERAVW